MQRSVVFKPKMVNTKMKNHEVAKSNWNVASIRYTKILTGLKLILRNCEPNKVYGHWKHIIKDYVLNDEMSLGILFIILYNTLWEEKNSPTTYNFAFYFQKCFKYQTSVVFPKKIKIKKKIKARQGTPRSNKLQLQFTNH